MIKTAYLPHLILFIVIGMIFISGNFRNNGNDGMWTALVSQSLVSDGDFNLIEYQALVNIEDHGVITYFNQNDRKEIWSPYPVTFAVVAWPVYKVAEFVWPPLSTDDSVERTDFLHVTRARLIGRWASAIMAWLSCFPFWIAFAFWFGRRAAFLATLLYAFATPVWHLSQSEWQQNPFFLFSMTAIALVASAPGRGSLPMSFTRCFLTGLLLGCAAASRYQDTIIFIPFTVFLI